MARTRRTRVNGPYKHRNRWRVFVVLASGRRNARSFATEAEAIEVVAQLTRKLAGEAIVRDAIRDYLAHVKAQGVRAVTLRNSERFLERFFGGKTSMPLKKVTPAKAQSLYDALQTRQIRGDRKGYAAKSHRMFLREAKRLGSWCVKAKLLRLNPFGAVEPVGRVRAGKEHLTSDESRKLMDYALSAFVGGDRKGLIPLLCLGLGLRAGEVAKLDVRHVNEGGRLLYVMDAKTAAGNRKLEVHDTIAACLAHQALGRAGQLIPGCTPSVVYHQVRRFCRLAGVKEVCPHALRGTHADLAAGRGATSVLLMEALGHTSIAVTQRHYLQAGTMEGQRAREVGRLLGWDPDASGRVSQAPIDAIPSGDSD